LEAAFLQEPGETLAASFSFPAPALGINDQINCVCARAAGAGSCARSDGQRHRGSDCFASTAGTPVSRLIVLHVCPSVSYNADHFPKRVESLPRCMCLPMSSCPGQIRAAVRADTITTSWLRSAVPNARPRRFGIPLALKYSGADNPVVGPPGRCALAGGRHRAYQSTQVSALQGQVEIRPAPRTPWRLLNRGSKPIEKKQFAGRFSAIARARQFKLTVSTLSARNPDRLQYSGSSCHPQSAGDQPVRAEGDLSRLTRTSKFSDRGGSGGAGGPGAQCILGCGRARRASRNQAE